MNIQELRDPNCDGTWRCQCADHKRREKSEGTGRPACALCGRVLRGSHYEPVAHAIFIAGAGRIEHLSEAAADEAAGKAAESYTEIGIEFVGPTCVKRISSALGPGYTIPTKTLYKSGLKKFLAPAA